jgi:hypothetical protein
MGTVVVLVAVKLGILLVSLAAKPIVGSEFVQEKLPPIGVLTKIGGVTTALLHTVMFAGTVTVGVGFTVMVKLEGVPTQPLTVGVTFIVAVIGAAVVLIAVNPSILPILLEANPIVGSEFVQEKLPPKGVLTKFVAATAALLQTTIFAGTVTVGVGFIVIVLESAIAEQPPDAEMVFTTI